MEFFDKLGKKASETYKATAEKTGKLAKEAKLKMKIAENRSTINDLYEEIGKKVYQKHIREEELNIKKDLEEECTKIDVLSSEIEANSKECLELKDMRQCEECDRQIEKDSKFCPECGAKQKEEIEEEPVPVKEVEIIDNVEKEEENNKENDENRKEEE